MSDLDKRIAALRQLVDRVLLAHQDLREEFDLLFKRSLDDRASALGRARRLLEILVVDQYIEANHLEPPYRNKLGTLFSMIENLAEKEVFTLTQQALCHAIRIEGNQAIHYKPESKGYSRAASVPEEMLLLTLRKLCELTDTGHTDNKYSCSEAYMMALPQRFREIYLNWSDCRSAFVSPEAKAHAVVDCIEMLLRSIFLLLAVGDIETLERCHPDYDLPEHLPDDIEQSFRRLRNAGLIDFDGDWLFTPTRSTKVWATARGRLLIDMSAQPESGTVNEGEIVKLATGESLALHDMLADERLAKLLLTVQSQGGSISGLCGDDLRQLRNKLLISHREVLLASATSVTITDLGYFTLGQYCRE